jgi:hypothetical protein
MVKKFNIHDWQQKHLFEQDDFTPDLEDDELKRSKIQQMMAKEKESEYELSDEEKDQLTDMTNEFVRKLTDIRGGNYSGDKLLAALQFVILNVQDMEPMLYTDTDGDGTPDVVDNDEELDEASILGTGTSVTGNAGIAYQTTKAFGKARRRKLYKEQEEPPSSEEEYEKDVEKIENLPILDKINTKDEWMDLMQVVLDMGDEIKTVNASVKKTFLMQAIKDINAPQ